MSVPVHAEVSDGLLRITLARPDAGNAVTPAVIDGLAAAVERAEARDVRAVLLAAEGRNFCVGADLRHLAGRSLPEELDRMATGFHAMLRRLAALPVPVVAAVQGNAVGGGLGLALAADLIVAAGDARFATGYTKLGLSADAGVSFFLTKALGPRLARSLLISARLVGAEEAAQLGLVDTLTAPDALGETAAGLAAELARGPSEAFAAIKRLVATAAAESDLSSQLDREQQEIVALSRTDTVAAAIAQMLAR